MLQLLHFHLRLYVTEDHSGLLAGDSLYLSDRVETFDADGVSSL